MTISIIAAISKNNIIGCEGNLPWHLSDDLKNFKKLTLNKPIIMGRKTFESIKKPLPNRTNIVISRNKYYSADYDTTSFPRRRESSDKEIIICHSLNSAIKDAKKYNTEIMIIGGAQIYQQAINLADKMYLTIVDAEVEGDVEFPQWNPTDWKLISEENFNQNDKNDFGFVVKFYEKILN